MADVQEKAIRSEHGGNGGAVEDHYSPVPPLTQLPSALPYYNVSMFSIFARASCTIPESGLAL